MEETLRNSQQAFISKVLSHTTHEFKNHLAIINETAGLMGDLLGMEPEGRVNKERYQKLIGAIQERVKISAELVLNLNHFGHRMDYPMSSFSLNDLLQEELKLLGRYAGQKQVEVSLDCSEELPAITNYPAICQYIFFVCFEHQISRFDGPGRIVVATSAKGEMAAHIELSVHGPAAAGTDDFVKKLRADCGYGLEKMQAELTCGNNENHQEKLTLSLVSLSPEKCQEN